MPLNGDAIDGSGNSRNGTLPNSSYYSREYIKGNSGRKCWRGKSSSLTTPCISGIYNSSELGNSPRTISVWMKFDNLGNLDEQVSPFWIGTANGGIQGGWFGLFCFKTSSYNSTLGILRYYSDPACNYNNYDTNWHNIIITYDDTNKAKVYVDLVEVTMTLNANVSFNTIGTNYYIGAGRTGDTGKLIRYSEFIIENKVWNQTDRQKYYNQTEGIYK